MTNLATNEVINAKRATATAKWLGLTLEQYLHRRAYKGPDDGHVRLGYSDPTASAAVGKVNRERGY